MSACATALLRLTIDDDVVFKNRNCSEATLFWSLPDFALFFYGLR